MQTAETEIPEELLAKLRDPQVSSALLRWLDRADELEQTAASLSAAAESLPGMVAAGADVVDEACRHASQSGVDIEARFQDLMEVFLQVTEPQNMAAIKRLVGRLPELEKASELLAEMPNLLATLGDIADDYARQAAESDIDLEKALTRGLHSVLWLGSRITDRELDRLGFLLRSHLLDEQALEVVGNAATALANCQTQSCESQTAERVGVFGLTKALSDPNIQRSVGFALRFARCFGKIRGDNAAC